MTLDDERAAKLARLAERMHVQEGTLARSLLATALDEAENLETLIAGHEHRTTRRRASRRRCGRSSLPEISVALTGRWS